MKTATTMNATQAVTSLPNLVDGIERRAGRVQSECELAGEQWAQLGRMGAQRDDHGAELLKGVRKDVAALHGFLAVVLKQLDGVISDPFGDGAEDNHICDDDCRSYGCKDR